MPSVHVVVTCASESVQCRTNMASSSPRNSRHNLPCLYQFVVTDRANRSLTHEPGEEGHYDEHEGEATVEAGEEAAPDEGEEEAPAEGEGDGLEGDGLELDPARGGD